MLRQVVVEITLAAEPRDKVAGVDALQLLGLLALGAGHPHLAYLGVFVGHSPRL